nr:MAG TPA: hypothetical protein [Caudoviricetes sp.]
MSYVPLLTALIRLFSSNVFKLPKSDICHSQQ